MAAGSAEAELHAAQSERLATRVDALGKENDMLQAMNKMFGEKLGSHIEQLSTGILVADRLPDDKKMFLALAGMKEIKDIL